MTFSPSITIPNITHTTGDKVKITPDLMAPILFIAINCVIYGTTKFIIAQRISSVEDADKIIVMDGGKVTAFGPHKQLLETSEIYREVYESQTRGGGDDE